MSNEKKKRQWAAMRDLKALFAAQEEKSAEDKKKEVKKDALQSKKAR